MLSSTQPLQLAKGKSADAFFPLGLLRSSDGQDTAEAEASGSEGSKFTILLPTPQLPFSQRMVLFFSVTLNLSSFQL